MGTDKVSTLRPIVYSDYSRKCSLLGPAAWTVKILLEPFYSEQKAQAVVIDLACREGANLRSTILLVVFLRSILGEQSKYSCAFSCFRISYYRSKI